MDTRALGVVKWFNVVKGYGFIGGPEGQDYFVHFSSIDMNGFRKLKQGQQVEFTIQTGPKGLHAADVRLI